MSVSAAIRKLIDAGMSVEQALLAAETFEEAMTPKRSAGAERTRRWRENKKATEASQNVTSVTSSQNVTSVAAPSEPSSLPLLPREEKKEVRSLRSLTVRAQADADFEEMWKVYPRRPNNPKEPARKAYHKARAEGATAEEVHRAAVLLAAAMAGEEPRYIPHTATWLNQKRFRDDPPEPTAAALRGKADVLAEACDAVIRKAEARERGPGYGDGETGQVLDWPVQRLPGFR